MPAQPTKILVVDDELHLREPFGRYLTEQGFAVLAVSDGMDRAFGRERFDLLVHDLMLPGGDGLAICRRLRAGDGRGHRRLFGPFWLNLATRHMAKAGKALPHAACAWTSPGSSVSRTCIGADCDSCPAKVADSRRAWNSPCPPQHLRNIARVCTT